MTENKKKDPMDNFVDTIVGDIPFGENPKEEEKEEGDDKCEKKKEKENTETSSAV